MDYIQQIAATLLVELLSNFSKFLTQPDPNLL
jgi:hypothetical protein